MGQYGPGWWPCLAGVRRQQSVKTAIVGIERAAMQSGSAAAEQRAGKTNSYHSIRILKAKGKHIPIAGSVCYRQLVWNVCQSTRSHRTRRQSERRRERLP